MSQINVDNIKNRLGSGAPSFPNGIDVSSGVTTFTNGLNVGTGASVFSPTTNVLALGTNSAERVRIDSSGRTGIGTIPSNFGNNANSLELHSPNSTQTYLTLTNTTTGSSGVTNGLNLAMIGTSARFLNRENGEIQFQINGTERLGITTTGNVEISNGNLVLSTSGTGIDFSATGGPTNGTGSSELLDDYEEGTFTPTFTAGTVSGSYTRQVGEYTKVGRLVTFTLTIDGNGLTGAAQALEIGGLPFTSRDVAEIGGAQVTYPGDFDTTNNRRFWLVAQNNTTLSYRDSSANNINGNAVNNVNSQLNLCGYYFTDS